MGDELDGGPALASGQGLHARHQLLVGEGLCFAKISMSHMEFMSHESVVMGPVVKLTKWAMSELTTRHAPLPARN